MQALWVPSGCKHPYGILKTLALSFSSKNLYQIADAWRWHQYVDKLDSILIIYLHIYVHVPMYTYMHTHAYISMSHWVIPLHLSQIRPPLPSLAPPPVLDTSIFPRTTPSPPKFYYLAGLLKLMLTALVKQGHQKWWQLSFDDLIQNFAILILEHK